MIAKTGQQHLDRCVGRQAQQSTRTREEDHKPGNPNARDSTGDSELTADNYKKHGAERRGIFFKYQSRTDSYVTLV
ncbi:hypothetical protein C0Q70_09668 [Pomacea canaliculata]|uniref:Uncharacterized protein n=1 Tax=Pomacea canaliculata TaxID=400727 RepID=A0A2T7PAG3_POMCA|nr:hypothetical protein C0Q70_09668 [Pomacea canaliculata]